MEHCAEENEICICPWGNTMAFGVRNEALWESFLNSNKTDDEKLDNLKLDNT